MKKWIKETICTLFGHPIQDSPIDIGCQYTEKGQVPTMIRFTCSRCGVVKHRKLDAMPYSQPSDKGNQPGQA